MYLFLICISFSLSVFAGEQEDKIKLERCWDKAAEFLKGVKADIDGNYSGPHYKEHLEEKKKCIEIREAIKKNYNKTSVACLPDSNHKYRCLIK